MPLAKATSTWSQFNPVMFLFFKIQCIYILVHQKREVDYVDFIDYVLDFGLKIILVRNILQILLILQAQIQSKYLIAKSSLAESRPTLSCTVQCTWICYIDYSLCSIKEMLIIYSIFYYFTHTCTGRLSINNKF